MRQYSIRQYVAWLTLIPLLIMAVGLETFFLHDRFSSMDHDLTERGKLIARQLASSSEYGVFSSNKPFLQSIALAALQQPDVRGTAILDAASEKLIGAGTFADTQKNTSNQAGKTVNLLTPLYSDGESLWIYQPIVSTQVVLDDLDDRPAAHQTGAIIIEMGWAHTSELKSRLFWSTVSATLLFLMVVIYLIFRASRNITAPISQLNAAMQMIGGGNLEMCVTVPTRVVELDNLTRGINAMTAQLQQRVEDETRIAAIAFESHEGMMVTDANGVILRVNSAFTRITGYTAEEAVGQPVRMLKSGRQDLGVFTAMLKSVKNSGTWQGEIWSQRKNGETYPARVTVTAVGRGGGAIAHYVTTLSDITVHKAAENEIKNLAFYDTLTQLPNRRTLMDRLSRAIAASKRTGRYGALMFLDLDNFKPLNDKFGHAVGDYLLIEASRRINSCLREVDTVARFGGDEFVVMLSELGTNKTESIAQASVVAEKIRTVMASTYQLTIPQPDGTSATEQYHCTSSIGIALFANYDASMEDVLKWADMAMYRAKRDGRNLTRFYESMED